MMMLPQDQTDHSEVRRPDSTEPYRPGGILLFGYLRKLKRLKKKYFILFSDGDHSPARLEYFDSEKKWKNGQTAKRSIVIKSCFNINRRMDCKHKFVVGLYTSADCFPIAFDCEEELLKWFITLLKIQLFDKVSEGEELKPIYEHVWQVTVQRKDLGSRKNIIGSYWLCLNSTARVLTLFKLPLTNPAESWEFPVMTIRRCGHSNCQFFMEMGRGTVTGAGELWMDLEDATVAQYVHGAVIEAMRNSAKEDLGPRQRTRSSSANEQNRPSLQQQQQPQQQPGWNPSTGGGPNNNTNGVAQLRNRAESVPSRSRTTSENVVVTPPDGRPSSVMYMYDGVSTSPPIAVKSSMPSSYSMDDFDPPLHPSINSHIRSRLSHTATPENSLPKESTILEEERTDSYLLMSQVDGPAPSGSDYLSMTPRGHLSSSPSAHSVSSIGPLPSSRSSFSQGYGQGSSSLRGGYNANKSRAALPVTSAGPPPIKPPLHPLVQPTNNAYMEMSSPVSTAQSSWASPPSLPDAYLPMFPPGSAPGSVGTRSGTHTRSSSFCEDPPGESYVPMAPQSVASSVTSRDGDAGSYMDMQCGGGGGRRSVPRELSHHIRGRLSPASGSSLASSFTSGTPPVGRFQEYHLEKVASFLTPSEDEDSLSSLSCRQSRAYSVGSRPDMNPRTRKINAVAIQPDPAAGNSPMPAGGPLPPGGYPQSIIHQESRVRAYSVGSRVAPANGKLMSTSSNGSSSSVNSSRPEMEPTVLPAQQQQQQHRASPTHQVQPSQQQDDHQRKKSLSVPYLSCSTATAGQSSGNLPYAVSNPTGTFFRTLLSQQQQQQQVTGRRENDLMELNFNRGLNGLHNTSSDSLGVDQVDGAINSSYSTGQYGSTDSVGRSSVASTNSSTTGRPRSASNQSRPSTGSSRGISSAGKPKLESFRSREGRLRLERLESVPQGRDQDYIEYGENKAAAAAAAAAAAQQHRGLESPDIGPNPSKSKKEHQEHDSADEYVELAQPAAQHRSSISGVRLSVSEMEQTASGLVSPAGSEYMVMDGPSSRSKTTGSLNAVLHKIAGHHQPSDYIDMNYGGGHKRTPSHPGSVSDDLSYLPMDFTPRSSRNASRQSSQVDLLLAMGTISPSMRGSQTPRSESARHSRTEESLQEPGYYMEMNFQTTDSTPSNSLRSDHSVRSRIPSPYGDGGQTDNESAQSTAPATPTVVTPTPGKSGSKKPAFLTNLFSRKSFSAGKTATSPTAVSTPTDTGTLPRSSRSMPPSPFSSLKRPSKSSKSSRRNASATCTMTSSSTVGSIAQSVSPVSPDVDLSALMFHQRGQSMRSHSMGHSRSSLHSPLTPPSPSADFSLVQPQFSPPSSMSSSSVHLLSKPCSSQPISIALQRPSYTPRGSPHTAIPALNLNRLGDVEDYVLPHTRYSTSPGRLMPTLSPLPEVLLNTMHTHPKTAPEPLTDNQRRSNPVPAETAKASNDGYMNMDFSSKNRTPATANTASATFQPAIKFSFDELPEPSLTPPAGIVPSTPSKIEATQPVRIPLKPIDDKNNSILPLELGVVESTPVNLVGSGSTSSSNNGSSASSAVTPTQIAPIPAKQRANSLEKIVCAFEKAIIGPKRHSSGDKPMKRSSATLIHRSNSYQPTSASRVIIAGNKPASLFPLLSDIPAGKVMAISSADNLNSKDMKSSSAQLTATGNRISSSSLVSLGEDLAERELQNVNWNANVVPSSTSATKSVTPITNGPSPATTLSSKSPSPSSVLLSRDCHSASLHGGSERQIHYAQLDLTLCQRSMSDDKTDEVPKSPRIPRPSSSSVIFAADTGSTAYAQIDFKKSEGLKAVGHP